MKFLIFILLLPMATLASGPSGDEKATGLFEYQRSYEPYPQDGYDSSYVEDDFFGDSEIIPMNASQMILAGCETTQCIENSILLFYEESIQARKIYSACSPERRREKSNCYKEMLAYLRVPGLMAEEWNQVIYSICSEFSRKSVACYQAVLPLSSLNYHHQITQRCRKNGKACYEEALNFVVGTF